MADKWPLATGNYSNAANWNGETLPVDGDNIYADNRTVTIDQNINLPNARFFNTARSGGTAGGLFSLSGSWNLTCLSITPGPVACISIPNDYTGTITCPTVNHSATAAAGGISINGGLNHACSIADANFYAGPVSGRTAMIASGSTGGTVTLVNCTAHSIGSSVATCMTNQSAGGLVIQGTCNLVQSSSIGNALLQSQTTGGYNLTGTVSVGGNSTLISLSAGGSCTYVCTALSWNSPLNAANVLFSSSSAALLDITVPNITMHNNGSGPILMSTNLAGSNCKYTGDVVAGICTIFQTTLAGAKLEHFGKITCNTVAGATLNAAPGSFLIIDKIEAAANGNFLTLNSGSGIRAKNTSCLYLQDSAGAVKTLSLNGGMLDLPIPANVRSGVAYNNGTQTGTMIDHDARFTAIDAILAKVDSAMQIDGLVWQFTANALELGPSGGGGGGLDAAGVRAALGMSAANLDSQLNGLGSTLVTIGSYIDTEVAAIKAKTDTIPPWPANFSTLSIDVPGRVLLQPTQTGVTIPTVTTVNGFAANSITAAAIAANAITSTKIAADAIGASQIATDAVAEIQTGLATSAALATVATYVDTEVAAIKATTDKLETAIELDGGVYRLTANALELAPTGSGGGSALTGARTVTLTVTLASLPLEGATVRISKGAETGIATTNASGQVVFNVNDGTWQVAITASGVELFAGASLVVDGDESASYAMTAASIPPSSTPSAATGYLDRLDGNNAPQSGVNIYVQMIAGPGETGYSYDTPIRREVSNVNGRVSFPDLVRGGTFRTWSGSQARSSEGVRFVVPATGENFKLPEIL